VTSKKKQLEPKKKLSTSFAKQFIYAWQEQKNVRHFILSFP
jgi:hypothetical protein